ncbi:hypothetical protein HMPREF0653_02326 [Prevotella disiens JCM 6334 = ATCC 29426]|uniref:Transposase DDE domain-containing protein n=2 Tax=Prevotella disiens TaxID=28130 RepID=E1KTH6_9BACT|nr:hypothetical protein HMPREF9296_1784 [Prevotella disiens FB035-09AN]ERJ72619.1 hypothetical protein HMPREF0653_02326 [Prevotella disiens JCM 6334 = ATCC 29426]
MRCKTIGFKFVSVYLKKEIELIAINFKAINIVLKAFSNY